MRRLIRSCTATAFAVLCSFASARIDHAKIVRALPFDEGGGPTAIDVGPNAHQAVLNAAEWGAGRFGGGIRLGGNGKLDVVKDPSEDLFDPR